MLGCSLGMAALQTSEFFGTGRDPKKLGSAHPRNAPYQAFKAADGHFVIAAGNNKLWEAVTKVVGRADLLADERFATTQLRAANQVALKDLLEVEFAKHGVDHWLAAFEKAGVPQGRINTYSQILADRQVQHMGWVEEMELPSGVKTRTFGSPVRISATDISKRRDPPALGADTDAIFGTTFQRKAAE
jgi:crotonobetainyl-CoA:carnitine CoA-transferase CaiB-like acyl-CoA transferase